MKSLLSIITINLNNSVGLISTFLSIKRILDGQNIEWIVIDGLSKDDSIVALENELKQSGKQHKIKIICEADQGIYDAMNKGITHASGKYLLFLNSGDMLIDGNLLNTWMRFVVNEKLPERSFFFGFKYLGRIRECKPAFWLVWKMMTSHQAMIIHESVFHSYCYDTRFRYASDFHLMSYLVKNFPYTRCPGILIENEPYGDGVFLKETRKEYCAVCSEFNNKILCFGTYLFKVLYEKVRLGK